MGSNYHGYGFEVLSNFLSGRECCRSARFPRVTMCDFEIRTMADHIHKHTIQVNNDVFTREKYSFWSFVRLSSACFP